MSENWVNFVNAEVFPGNSQERVTVARVKGRDDLADICAKVTDQIRQAYVFGGRDLGEEAGTIPDGLKARAIAIALWRFVSEGVPKMPALQTAQREGAFKEAMGYIEKIAAGETGKASAPSVGCKHRKFGYRWEDGI